jgi:hypothetical protein
MVEYVTAIFRYKKRETEVSPFRLATCSLEKQETHGVHPDQYC